MKANEHSSQQQIVNHLVSTHNPESQNPFIILINHEGKVKQDITALVSKKSDD
jgi:hypothetical protein